MSRTLKDFDEVVDSRRTLLPETTPIIIADNKLGCSYQVSHIRCIGAKTNDPVIIIYLGDLDSNSRE